MSVTAKSVTTDALCRLRSEATEAEDYLVAAMCDLAIDGEIDTDDYSCLERHEARRLRSMTRAEALDACVDAINAQVQS